MTIGVSVHRINAIVVEDRLDITGTYYRTIRFQQSGETMLEVTAFGDKLDDLHLYTDDGDSLVPKP